MVYRELSPGETGSPRREGQTERQFLSRVHSAQIQSIDANNGTLDVVVLDLGSKVTVEIPMTGMSPNRTQSSWFRYMPQVNDIVLVQFDHTNAPKCIGYALQGNDASAVESTTQNTGKFVPRLGGYKSLAQAKTASDGGSSENDPDILSLDAGAGVDIDDCVAEILCGLSQAALNALKTLLQTQLAFVEGEILLVEATLLRYNILQAGLSIAANAVEAVIAEIRAEANIVPLSLISSCLPLGNLNIAINGLLDKETASLEAIVNDLSRILSFVDEQNFVLSQLRQTEQLFNKVIAAIQTCATIRQVI